jgi:hypothetical protein
MTYKYPGFFSEKTDLELDKKTIKRPANIEKLPETDEEHIIYAIDNLIKAAKFKALE